MRIIYNQGKEILLNRMQCLRDFISSLQDIIDELIDRRVACCEVINAVTDENDDLVGDEEENNIIF